MDRKLTFEGLPLVLRCMPFCGGLADCEVEQFLCCSHAGKVSSGLHCATDCGVKAFNGIGGIDGLSNQW